MTFGGFSDGLIMKDLTPFPRQPFDANWAKKATEVIETAVSVVVPVKVNMLALDFQDGI